MTAAVAKLWLKPGREKSLRRRHPWVFSGAVQRVEGASAPGSTVEIVGSAGEFLALAAFSPESQIRARVWTFDRGERIDAAWFRARLARALESRRKLGMLEARGACRVVFAESDGLAGLDRRSLWRLSGVSVLVRGRGRLAGGRRRGVAWALRAARHLRALGRRRAAQGRTLVRTACAIRGAATGGSRDRDDRRAPGRRHRGRAEDRRLSRSAAESQSGRGLRRRRGDARRVLLYRRFRARGLARGAASAR